MKFGSLFAGIGGFDLGFERAGMECAWQCETDQAASDVLAYHWPSVTNHGDVNHVGKHNLAAVDVVCGGFPCQDLSVAGKGAGLAGERSGLWFQFHRIVTELRPRWVVVENVPGLLSSNDGRDFAVILRGLVECGYGVAYRILDAQYDGVAQRRRRVFIVGSLGNGRAAQVLFESESLCWNSAPRREAGQGITGTIAAGAHPDGYNGQDASSGMLISAAQTFHDTGAGWYDEAEQLRAISARDYKDGGPRLVAYNIQHNDGGEHRRKDRPNGGLYVNETDTALTVGSTDMTAIAFNYKEANCGFDMTPTLSGGGGGGMGDGMSVLAFTERSRADGRNFEAQEGLAYALTNPGSGGRTHSRQIAGQFGVRRLTPTECERLQGFPDGWTVRGASGPQSDSARYRQLGNAVCVPVAEWVGRRITEEQRQ